MLYNGSMRSIFFFVAILLMLPFASLFAAESFTRDLSWGLQNDPDVKRLQEYLRDKGFYVYAEITGHYFSSTRSAVLKFQAAQNITPADGVFSGKTRTRLNQLFQPTIQTPLFTPFFRDLFFGFRADPDVVRLQEFLRNKGFFTYPESTGNYFTVTKEAVLAYQLGKKIPPTGSMDRLPAHLSIWISLPQILEDPPMNQLKCFLHPKPQPPPTINKSASRVSAAKTQTR